MNGAEGGGQPTTSPFQLSTFLKMEAQRRSTATTGPVLQCYLRSSATISPPRKRPRDENSPE